MGCLIAIAYVSIGLIGKAALEAGYFKDRRAAKRTLASWLVAFMSISLALGFTLLIDYSG